MIKIVKKAALLLLPLASLSLTARAQDIPAVTGPGSYSGFSLPVSGTLTYALSGSLGYRTGYLGNGNNVVTTNVSGDIAYLSSSDVHPFSMTYSGGYIYFTGGENSQVFQNLALSQTFHTRSLNFVISDTMSYLPQAPVTGLSGIPGVGDVGVTTGPTDNNTDILTGEAPRITNTVSGSASRPITGSTSLSINGGYDIQRYVGDSQGFFSTDQASGGASVSHRINALNSIQGNYSYSHYTYPSQQFTFVNQGITVAYQKQFTRRLSMSASIGPQRTSTASITTSTASLNIGGNASVSYTLEGGSMGASYSRAVQSGSGIVQGTLTDTISLSLSHTLDREWHASGEASYSRHGSISALTTSSPYSFNSMVASVQLSRAVAENLSAFGSYSLQRQSSDATTSVNAFSGLSQTFSAGITYSPRPSHIGHQ